MPRFYLSTYVGSGSEQDPFRPSGADEVGEWSSIDLRPPGVAEGRCLLVVPDALPPAAGLVALGDDLDDRSTTLRKGLASRLGLNLDDGPLRRIVFDLLWRHGSDARKDRWNQLKPEVDGWHRVWLGELIHEQPRMFAASTGDTFNRANNADLSVGAPFPWTDVLGDFQILNARASAAAPARSRGESALASVDHYVQALVTLATATATRGGIMGRFAAAADTAYSATRQRDVGGATFLSKTVAATTTTLATGTATVGGPTVEVAHRLDCNGSSITALFGGVDSLNVTDTAITTGVRGGIVGFTVGGADRVRIRNFQAGELNITVNATAAGTLTLTGAATAKRSVPATAAGSLVLNGAATLTVGHTAQAAGSLTLNGATTATRTVPAAVAGQMVLNSAATLTVGHTAQASGQLVLSGTAAATRTVPATAAGQLQLDGTATATTSANVEATAHGTLSLAGTVTLTVGHTAEAAGTLTLTGSATATRVVPATVAGLLVLASSATLTIGHTAQALGLLELVGTAVGTVTTPSVEPDTITYPRAYNLDGRTTHRLDRRATHHLDARTTHRVT